MVVVVEVVVVGGSNIVCIVVVHENGGWIWNADKINSSGLVSIQNTHIRWALIQLEKTTKDQQLCSSWNNGISRAQCQNTEDDVHETAMEFKVEQTNETDRKKEGEEEAKKTTRFTTGWEKCATIFFIFEQKKTHKLLYKRKYTPNKMKMTVRRRKRRRRRREKKVKKNKSIQKSIWSKRKLRKMQCIAMLKRRMKTTNNQPTII